MNEEIIHIDGLPTTAVASAKHGGTLVVLLHGYSMTPADLAPFAHSLGTGGVFLFPEGPLPALSGGRSWFPMDDAARQAAQRTGPRDLAERHPAGLAAARERLGSYLRACAARFRPEKTVLGGFSQGGMLACDAVLHGTAVVDALLLMSASRLNIGEWQAHAARLGTLPVLISHGKTDPDLAFSAGAALRDFVAAAGAEVTWLPFDGGHEIPLVVWRAVRKFLRRPCLAPSDARAE